MATLRFTLELTCSVERLRDFHADTSALRALTPPVMNLQILSEDLAVRPGNVIETVAGFGPIRQRWVARIERVDETGFVDVADRSPFRWWRHEHRFEATAAGSRLTDTVEYRTGFGPIGDAVAGIGLRLLFGYRHRVTREALAGP
ncbi:MAG: SRPBCC family protein [Fimbriimonadaceae bacterium]|nr:SRPBCC family protein [Fimbriimonadaceae bacterium]